MLHSLSLALPRLRECVALLLCFELGLTGDECEGKPELPVARHFFGKKVPRLAAVILCRYDQRVPLRRTPKAEAKPVEKLSVKFFGSASSKIAL